MKLPFGKIQYAFAFLLVILTTNVLMAQELLKQHVDNPGQTAAVDNPGQTEMKDAAAVDNPGQTPMKDTAPTGHVPGVLPPTMDAIPGPVGLAVVTGNGINYHGGPVLKGNPVKFYVIWYGNWSGSGSNTMASVSLVEHFINTLGNTPYEKIATTYGDNTGNVSGNVTLGGHTFVVSSTNLTDASLQTTVKNALTSGALPTDAGGVYFVLSSSNINETSGFCTQYCGFHTHATLNGADIKYAFVGNPDRCPSACEIQTTGPNSPSTGVGGADGMINVFAHEQFEAITDPDLNAWFDTSGNEDSDKCNFNFGTTNTCVSGSLCTPAGIAAHAKWNVSFGNNDWMIQQQWKNAGGGGCVLHL
jgi:hypothetical protein